jgi:hypothetical protein
MRLSHVVYGFIEEILELEYPQNLKVMLFHCQWVEHLNGVKIIKYGMTTINFKFVSYREELFVFVKDVTQVFYVKDPTNKECHIILQGKRKIVGIEDVVDEKDYN